MLEAAIFLIFYAILVLTDLVPLFRDKHKKAAVFCTALFGAVALLQFLEISGVELPSPSALITGLVEGIFGKGVG